jgi:hypothetical protein
MYLGFFITIEYAAVEKPLGNRLMPWVIMIFSSLNEAETIIRNGSKHKSAESVIHITENTVTACDTLPFLTFFGFCKSRLPLK